MHKFAHLGPDLGDENAARFPKFAVDNGETVDQHFEEYHADGIEELWMYRPWPMQEMLLSDNLHFTFCDAIEPDQNAEPEPQDNELTQLGRPSSLHASGAQSHVIANLQLLIHDWYARGN
jgi:hypothetical protein